MKTIYGCLPFYDSIVKQDYNRIKSILPIICPTTELPSFQFALGSDAIATGTPVKVELISPDYYRTEIDYDDTEIQVGTDWTYNSSFNTFTHTNLEISSAINTAGSCTAISNDLCPTIIGTQIRFKGTLTLNSGTAPTIMLNGVSAGSLSVGVNDIIIASTLVASTCNIVLYLNAATNYSLTNVSITQLPGTLGLTSFFAETPTIYQPTDTNLSRCIKYNGGTLTSSLPLGIYYLCVTAGAYSYYSDYIAVVSMANPMLRFMKINFSNAKNLGNICYEDGFSQTVWFEAILNNPSHEIVNTGEEKDGIFIAEKITTKFIYSIIAYVTRSLYNCLVRLPQHSTITITDEVGNTYTPSVGNIIVSPGEWSYFDVCRLTINFNDGENSSFPWTN